MFAFLNFDFAPENAYGQGGPVYLCLLLWSFLAVAVVSDRFMSAIEVITSTEKHVFIQDEKTGEKNKVRIKVWNDTVANLTLMALGSSAPEILLSIVELLNNSWFSGALGPNTVVGSAAFNLMVISAVCVYSIPTGEVRFIIGLNVYFVTCTFSVLAYFWLIVILQFISPNRVDLWESILTLLFFPILVALAYLMDIDYFFQKKHQPDSYVVPQGRGTQMRMSFVDQKEQLKIAKAGLQGEHLTDEDLTAEVLQNMAAHAHPNHSKAYYKVNFMRKLVHAKHIEEKPKPNVRSLVRQSIAAGHLAPEGWPCVKWKSTTYACIESSQYINITAMRTGNFETELKVDYSTRDGSAQAKTDYVPVQGTLSFAPNIKEATLTIEILDDDQWEEDEEFYVDLMNVDCSIGTVLGKESTTTIMVIDDDDVGMLGFKEDVLDCEVQKRTEISVEVMRSHGASGSCSCTYETDEGTAKAGVNFTKTQGKLEFGSGEIVKTVPVVIYPPEGPSEDSSIQANFTIKLRNAEGGTAFGEWEDFATCTINVIDASRGKPHESSIDQVLAAIAEANEEHVDLGAETYYDQFMEAIYVGGEADEQADAGCNDWFMHIVALPWKLLCACIPPPSDYWFGGKATFVGALAVIGLITAFIGDMATLLGCCINWPDDVTAITLVALGTSLPDTFASKSAALGDETADNSVGNVTGSNSVNVFLGLGLPWTLAALYWEGWRGLVAEGDSDAEGKLREWLRKGFPVGEETYGTTYWSGEGGGCTSGACITEISFVVPAGSLGPSVGVYVSCALMAMGILYFNRQKTGGELGGEFRIPIAATLLGLWFIYLACSIVISMGQSD